MLAQPWVSVSLVALQQCSRDLVYHCLAWQWHGDPILVDSGPPSATAAQNQPEIGSPCHWLDPGIPGSFVSLPVVAWRGDMALTGDITQWRWLCSVVWCREFYTLSSPYLAWPTHAPERLRSQFEPSGILSSSRRRCDGLEMARKLAD